MVRVSYQLLSVACGSCMLCSTASYKLPCSFEPYECGECQKEYGCSCGACEILDHAVCTNTSSTQCKMQCERGYSAMPCGLACTECRKGGGPPLPSWMRWLGMALTSLTLGALFVLSMARNPRCVARIRRFRRWLHHPTLRAVSRSLDRHCCSQRADAAGFEVVGNECSICLDEFDGPGIIRTLPCPAAPNGHTFHKDCIDRWLWVHAECPLCKHSCRAWLGLRDEPEAEVPDEVPARNNLELGHDNAGAAAAPLADRQ